MDWWTGLGAAVERFLADYGLLAAFVLITVEEAGVPSPVPADLLVLLFGVQARAGGVSLWQAVAVAELATILGASTLYFLARRAGRDVVYRYGRYIGLGPARLNRVEARLRRAGIWTVAAARITPGVRVGVALACGVFEVPYRVFLPGMAIGALGYLLVFALLGYVVGPSVAAALSNVHLPISSLLSLGLLAVALVWLARARADLVADDAGAGQPGRARAGLLAGTLASVCSALGFNALTGLVGAVTFLATLPAVREAQARFVADQRRVVPIVAGVLVFVLIGALWGAVYALWGEPLLRRVVRRDALRGVVFAIAPWALVAGTVALVANVDDVGVLVVALVEGIQQATFGVVLGTAYPLLRARTAAWTRAEAGTVGVG